MMRKSLKVYGIIALCCALTAGCSTTKNLPEEEVLYTGIKEIDYGQNAKKKNKKSGKKKRRSEEHTSELQSL